MDSGYWSDLYTIVSDKAYSMYNRWWTGDWLVTVINNTGGQTTIPAGKEVTVMIFQASSNSQGSKSYSSPWLVQNVPSPGQVGPIPFPKNVHFGTLDTVSDGIPRLTGPSPVSFGQNVKVKCTNSKLPPRIEIRGKAQDNMEIRVTSASGNVKELEMALYKSDKKLVSFKGVMPNQQVCFRVEPLLYIADVNPTVGQGKGFETSIYASRATKIKLSPEKLDVKIEITQRANGQLDFSEIR